MEIIKYKLNDVVELKKPHPCGSKQFKILRVGSEMRIVCMGCGRDMVIDRIKLEKATKKVYSEFSQQGAPHHEP
ncbi:MAG: DUF951 domain-containing protein [Clostridia bacterium]|nr:DUF951 domain-containing protein [Clostridia bacterium]